jgi:hypothetical protein
MPHCICLFSSSADLGTPILPDHAETQGMLDLRNHFHNLKSCYCNRYGGRQVSSTKNKGMSVLSATPTAFALDNVSDGDLGRVVSLSRHPLSLDTA